MHLRHLFIAILFLGICYPHLQAESTGRIEVHTRSDLQPIVPFDYWLAEHSPANQVLMLVPGYNHAGLEMFTSEWKDFARKHHLVLLAPSFLTNPQEISRHQGYYYPEQWSGEATESALSKLSEREGVSTDKIMLFGFSAGAHFVYGYALWKPDRVKAAVAYSAGWWDPPTEKLATVPELIMCGEEDPRYDATLEVMTKAQALDLPWVWRSYSDTGHQITGPVQRMAAAFLGHYADGEKDDPLYGDMQTYKYVSDDKKDDIPPGVRIRLPSKAVAEQWILEN